MCVLLRLESGDFRCGPDRLRPVSQPQGASSIDELLIFRPEPLTAVSGNTPSRSGGRRVRFSALCTHGPERITPDGGATIRPGGRAHAITSGSRPARGRGSGCSAARRPRPGSRKESSCDRLCRTVCDLELHLPARGVASRGSGHPRRGARIVGNRDHRPQFRGRNSVVGVVRCALIHGQGMSLRPCRPAANPRFFFPLGSILLPRRRVYARGLPTALLRGAKACRAGRVIGRSCLRSRNPASSAGRPSRRSCPEAWLRPRLLHRARCFRPCQSLRCASPYAVPVPRPCPAFRPCPRSDGDCAR